MRTCWTVVTDIGVGSKGTVSHSDLIRRI
jgi:hypothetical protein